MKPTENYEQLILRFTNRTAQLTNRADELYEAYAEYVNIQEDLTRLQGSLQAIEYLAYGRFDDSFFISEQLAVRKLCEDHSVDVDYGKDRVAFFAAIIEQMENPYK